MNLGISNLEQLPWQTANAFEELIVQIQAFMNGQASTIDPNQTTARPFDQSTLFDHVNTQFATNAPWSLRWLKGPWLADPDGNSAHVAILRPPVWAANQHDYAPQGIDTALGMEVETDAARDLTGVKIAARSKRFLLIVNVGNFAITIKHNDATSAAVNRFGLPAGKDLVLGAAEMAWMFYSVGSEVWRLAGTSSSTYAGATGSPIFYAVRDLVLSELQNLHSSPITIVPASVGNIIVPLQWTFHDKRGTVGFTGTPTLSLGYPTITLSPILTIPLIAGATTSPGQRYSVANIPAAAQNFDAAVNNPSGRSLDLSSNTDVTGGGSGGAWRVSVAYYYVAGV